MMRPSRLSPPERRADCTGNVGEKSSPRFSREIRLRDSFWPKERLYSEWVLMVTPLALQTAPSQAGRNRDRCPRFCRGPASHLRRETRGWRGGRRSGDEQAFIQMNLSAIDGAMG